MDYKYLYEEIPFINKEDTIEQIQDTASGALVLKITKNQKNYFFKLYKGKKDEIHRIRNISELYSKFSKAYLYIIDCGVTSDDKVWFVFNWINGSPLNQLYHSNINFYQCGYDIGVIYKKLNQIIKKDRSNPEFNIQEALDLQNNFNNLYKKERCFYDNFDKEILNRINRKYLEFFPIFDTLEKEYIHGDLHPKNIMLDNDNNLVLIDMDSFRLDYLVYNFRWSIASIYKHDENRLFFKGFINGRYEDKVPKEVNQLLLFILIFKFYEQSVAYYHSKRLDIIENYIKEANKVFCNIDLEGNKSILD